MVEQGEAGGGQPALAVASAHLTELIDAIDAINSKVMFMMGLNVASNSLFVAVIASLSQPWWSAIAPVILATAAVGLGLGLLRRGPIPQFPAPNDLMQIRQRRLGDDTAAWLLVATLSVASEAALAELQQRYRRAFSLWIVTVAQIVSITAIGLVLVL